MIGETGETGDTGDGPPADSLIADSWGVETERFDFEELGRMLGKAEYEAHFPPLLFFLTTTVPVEFEDEREESDSLDKTRWRPCVRWAFEVG